MRNKVVLITIISVIIASLSILGIITSIKHGNTNPKEIQVTTDHEIYQNTQELTEAVDLVIIGEPINNFTEDKPVVTYYTGKNADPTRKSVEAFHTLRPIKIHKVLKGTITSKVMNIAEISAIVDGPSGKETLLSSDYSIAEKGKRYIFFLKKGYTGDYFIMAVNQGKFNIDGSDESEKSKENQEVQFNKLKKDVLTYYKNEISQ